MRGRKILIVDDSRTQLMLMAALLRAHGYDVITATDGDEALSRIYAEQPDCVVLDVVLPKQNGFQLCRRLKLLDAQCTIPIILISGNKTPIDRQWGMEQGADLFLCKPFSGEELLAGIESVL
jgi:twitching motility two-component system response regulator PilH